ncbi:3-deoxy-8-phosphooctulonate synthase [Leptospira perolatii]|uniref:2-dehydro-3-deoxyphosphooctonate aldolase n=1 Tax=Leptospira perolatii TaxID=2023191 RepID=A0A2M9ZJ43_9LEPT|nr:3-deoxy-8-phosphooctulonate synthase [Leptospira perolatii]PJZ69527.1 3-deoxy-8-phosphooctulonate synthase [Leptospira perolatii]PJZ72042.1 3-deoxy-8-phosphooctulonate synthase [Leptospira perolatii]
MSDSTAKIRKFIGETEIGGDKPFFLIAGPCVMENRELLDRVCGEMVEICSELKIPYVFKSSFDKANRSSVNSYRGPGLKEGISHLEFIKKKYKVPVLTDIHETSQIEPLRDVIDVYQIPAFLCRQTDLIAESAKTGRWVNVKKGQFLSPQDCRHIKTKIQESGSEKYLVTERGTSFGYGNLVFDGRVIPILHNYDIPVVFDGTHSAQLPGAAGNITGGQREYIPSIVRSAVALGIEGIFMEVHPDPEKALSDATTQYPIDKIKDLLKELIGLDRYVKKEILNRN